MFQGPLKRADAAEKAAYLLIWVGEACREICRSWGLSVDEKKNFDGLITKFRAHVTPTKNKVFARYIFQERSQ